MAGLTFNQGVRRSSRRWLTIDFQRRTLVIVVVIRVCLFVHHLFYLIKGHTDFAIFVVEDDQHFVVINIKAVQEYADQPLLFFNIVKVGRSKTAYPVSDILFTYYRTLDLLLCDSPREL